MKKTVNAHGKNNGSVPRVPTIYLKYQTLLLMYLSPQSIQFSPTVPWTCKHFEAGNCT